MKRAFILSFLLIFFVFMLVLSVTYQFGLPYTYMLFSLFLSLLSIVIVYQVKGNTQWVAYLSVIALFIFLRIDYNVASNFSFIPLADGYQDYAVARVLMENGRYSVITSETGLIGLSHPSAWPLLHILGSSLSMITTIDLLYVVLALPLVFSLLILMFVFLFIREVAHKFGLSKRFILLSVLIYTVSPDNIYTQMQFVRQSFAMVFFTIIVYFLLFRLTVQVRLKSARTCKALLLFFVITLVLVHDFTPFTMLLFLGVFYVLANVISHAMAKWKISLYDIRFPLSLSLLLFISIVLFVWWSYQATVIWTTQRWILESFLQPRIEIFSYTLESAEMRWGYYNVLRPQLYTYLLNIRDAAIYVPSVIAFSIWGIRTFQRKRLTARESFLMYSIVAFSLVLIYYELILGLQPLRVIWLSAPLIAYFAASFYEYMFSRKKVMLRIATFSLMTLTVFSAFLSPWAHLYVPLYIYQPSTKFEDVGSHSVLYSTVTPFVENYLVYDGFKALLSDDPLLLYIVLPTESYPEIKNLHASPDIIYNNTENTAIFEFSYLNPSFYILNLISKEHSEVLENIEGFKQQIMLKYNLVYSSGFSKIYMSNHFSGEY